MKLTKNILQECLIKFAKLYVEKYQQEFGHLPLVEIDEQWKSPCTLDKFNESLVQWQPVIIKESLSFGNIEKALEIEIHQDISNYFMSIYSESVPASCSEGHLSLLFAWCEADFERLQENIIGHVLMKQKLKQPITIFFAVTDEEDTILSVNNENGEVWAERVGCIPHKKVAEDIESFINSLEPLIQADS